MKQEKTWINEPYPRNMLLEAYGEETIECFEPFSRDMMAGLHYVLSTLKEREMEILKYRYVDREPLSEIAKRYSLTRESIRKYIFRAFQKLRRPDRYYIIKQGMASYMNEMFDSLYQEGYTDGQISARNKLTGEIPKVGFYDIALEDLNISIRSFNCLKRAGINTVGECMNCDFPLRIRYMGMHSVCEIATVLEAMGITDTAWSDIKKTVPYEK